MWFLSQVTEFFRIRLRLNFFNLFLIERKLLYNIVLVSAVHQHESVIGIHMSPPS